MQKQGSAMPGFRLQHRVQAAPGDFRARWEQGTSQSSWMIHREKMRV
jgi:hypothetical protein